LSNPKQQNGNILGIPVADAAAQKGTDGCYMYLGLAPVACDAHGVVSCSSAIFV